jgi:hypothetical protein
VAQATKVYAGTITSSPGATPAALSATNSASVPLPSGTAWPAAQRLANRAANSSQ